jgi:zinc protease
VIRLTGDKAMAGTTAARIQRVVSPGGIEAWLIEERAVPLVALEFAFQGGSAQDSPERAGLAAMMAGLLDEGAGPHEALAFQELLEEHAIMLRFSESRDMITGSVKTLTRHQDKAFELLKLAVNEPRFDASAVDRVRAQLSSGVRRQANDPNARASKAWFASAFAGHAYASPERGTLESLAGIDREQVVRQHGRLFARSSLKVAVVGAIDAETLARALDEVFLGLPADAALVAVPQVAPRMADAAEFIDLDIPQSTIRFGLPGLLRKDDDFVAATVMNHILGGGSFTSRLWQEVREKRGLAYSVSANLYPFAKAGFLMGGTATKNERAREAMDVIRGEIARMAADGPTEEEVAKAKSYLIGSYALRFDTSTKIANQLLMLQVEELGIEYTDRRNGLFAAITVDDAARVAKRLLSDNRMLVTVAGRPIGF